MHHQLRMEILQLVDLQVFRKLREKEREGEKGEKWKERHQ